MYTYFYSGNRRKNTHIKKKKQIMFYDFDLLLPT